MTQSLTTSSISSHEALRLIEVKPGVQFGLGVLVNILPDVETALFFGKVYDLDAKQLGSLLATVFRTPLTEALFSGGHSAELQDYLVDIASHIPEWERGEIEVAPVVPKGEILPHVWEQLELEIAASIKEVAAKLINVVDRMPGKQGAMVFKSMRVMNAKRPILGDYKATIHHQRQQKNLVILDVSGSMSASTIQQIVEDVVALSYKANAHMAIVSDTCSYWEPGTYDTSSILGAAEYSGTHYEQLTDLLDQDWGVVVTIADYDSSHGAKGAIAQCGGHIDEVVDISLVNRATFLGECVGQLADKVTPMLVANTMHVLGSGW